MLTSYHFELKAKLKRFVRPSGASCVKGLCKKKVLVYIDCQNATENIKAQFYILTFNFTVLQVTVTKKKQKPPCSLKLIENCFHMQADHMICQTHSHVKPRNCGFAVSNQTIQKFAERCLKRKAAVSPLRSSNVLITILHGTFSPYVFYHKLCFLFKNQHLGSTWVFYKDFRLSVMRTGQAGLDAALFSTFLLMVDLIS